MNKLFDYGKWKAKLLFEPGRYDFLYHYVNDDEAILKHAEKSYSVRSLTSDGEDFERDLAAESEQFRSMFTDHISEGINEALNTLSRQMIVVCVSFIEGIVSELLHCLFKRNPESMYEYLGRSSDAPKGWIPLAVVLDSNDKDSLLEQLAVQASLAASSGDMKAVMKRIEKLGKGQIPVSLKKEVSELCNLRNKIVHEQYEPEVEKSDVISAFEVADEFLRSCTSISVKRNVPINDPTYEFLEMA